MTDAASRLRTLAVEFLHRASGDLIKAARALDITLASKTDLRIALATDYLARLGASAKPDEPAKPAEKPKPAEKAKRETAGRRKTGTNRRGTGMPTDAQKAGARAAASEMAAGIFNRKVRGGHRLRTIKIRELRAIVMESGHAAGSFVNRGYEDAVDAILCRKLAEHCVTADPDATVIDCVNETTADQYYRAAKLEAARFISHAAMRIALELSNTPPEIGAAS